MHILGRSLLVSLPTAARRRSLLKATERPPTDLNNWFEMALTLGCRHQAIGQTRVVHRTFYTCLEWQVQESTAQLNVVKAWTKSHWLWSVLTCACSESESQVTLREIYALWPISLLRPFFVKARNRSSLETLQQDGRQVLRFNLSISFRQLWDIFDTSTVWVDPEATDGSDFIGTRPGWLQEKSRKSERLKQVRVPTVR